MIFAYYAQREIKETEFGQVFTRAVAHDAIGEGLPWLGGVIADVAVGLFKDTVWDGVTKGELVSPFNRLSGASDRSYAAQWGRWGSHNLGQPLSEFAGVGNVRAMPNYDEENGLHVQVSYDGGKSYRVGNGWENTGFILGNTVGDPTNWVPGLLALKAGRYTKMGVTAYNVMDMGAVGLGVGLPLIDTLVFDPKATSDFVEFLAETEGLEGEGEIRSFQRALNDYLEETINDSWKKAGIDGEQDYRSLELTGELDAETQKRLHDAASLLSYSVNIYDNAQDAQDSKYHEQMVSMEQNFIGLLERYQNDPEGFDPSANELMALQFGMVRSRNETTFGEAGRAETLAAIPQLLDKQLGVWKQVLVEAQEQDPSITDEFIANVDIATMIDVQQEQLSRELAVAQARTKQFNYDDVKEMYANGSVHSYGGGYGGMGMAFVDVDKMMGERPEIPEYDNSAIEQVVMQREAAEEFTQSLDNLYARVTGFMSDVASEYDNYVIVHGSDIKTAPLVAEKSIIVYDNDTVDLNVQGNTQPVEAEHIVKSGESLSGIVASHYGLDPKTHWDDVKAYTELVAKHNNLPNIHRINPDDQLKLPVEQDMSAMAQGYVSNDQDWNTFQPRDDMRLASLTLH